MITTPRRSYALDVSNASGGLAESIRAQIERPEIAAMLLAKTTIATERGVAMTLTEDSRLPATGLETSTVLTIVGNLIDNAIDAAAGGARGAAVVVRLTSRRTRCGSRCATPAPACRIDVAAQIFDDGFTTKAAAPDRQRGIGLALVHRLVRRSGGSIAFESGNGPGRHGVHRGTPAECGGRLRGPRVIKTLIVEDDYHVASIHGAYLRRVDGFEVAGHASTLASGRAEIASGSTPGLVLLDIYLPDGNGIDLIREALEVEGPRPDFLVITAARDMKSVRAAMQLGAVHYLVKPFNFQQLEERLIAYRELSRRLDRIGDAEDEAEQHEVDALYNLLRGARGAAKGTVGSDDGVDPRVVAGLFRGPLGRRDRRAHRYQPVDRPALPCASWAARARLSCAFTTERPGAPSIAIDSQQPRTSRYPGLLRVCRSGLRQRPV